MDLSMMDQDFFGLVDEIEVKHPSASMFANNANF